MDGIRSTPGSSHHSKSVAALLPPVLVVSATNHPNVLDPALRRAGRFDRELSLAPPTVTERLDILKFYTGSLPLRLSESKDSKSGSDSDKSGVVDLSEIAERSVGYVGADIEALVREACHLAMKQFLARSNPSNLPTEQLIGRQHFISALDRVPASARRSHSLITSLTPASLVKAHQLTTSETTAAGGGEIDTRAVWSSIGGLESIKRKLTQLISFPLLYPSACARLGLKRNGSGGVLLYGPPGCSKTSLVRALCASTPNASFFALDAASVYSAYVGEAEEVVRELFELGRRNRPAVICLDEIDAIVGKRGWGGSGGGASSGSSGVEARLISTLLNEMDGVGDAGAAASAPRPNGEADSKSADGGSGSGRAGGGVIVVGTTNRVDRLDDALLRPGRFDHVLYVPPPDAPTRLSILIVHTRAMPLASDMTDTAPEQLLAAAEQFLNDKQPATDRKSAPLPAVTTTTTPIPTDVKSTPLAASGDSKTPIALTLLATDLYTAHFSGADCANLCREAAMAALRSRSAAVGWRHFLEARLCVRASLPPRVLEMYDKQF